MKAKNTFGRTSTLILIFCALLSTSSGNSICAEDIPLEKESVNDKFICLGTIGARVFADDIKGTTFISYSHSNLGTIKYIYKNSLAEGKLQLEDVIVGIDGKKFDNDFSRRIAFAIDRAEGSTGKIMLNVERGGKSIKVSFILPKIGSFSATYPYNCKKSDVILEMACDWLVRHMDGEGRLDGGGYIVNSAVGGLALLGSGNPKYHENIKRLAETMIRFFSVTKAGSDEVWPGQSLSTWSVVYGAIFLSEYFLVSGDASVLPTLSKLNKNIEIRQFHKAPPVVRNAIPNNEMEAPLYWFGHDFLNAGGGYKCLGVNVANVVLGWELLLECGVGINRENFEKTRDYIQIAAPDGEMKYAGGPNQGNGDGDAIGRTGVLAVAYALCGDRKEHSIKIASTLNRLQAANYFHAHARSAMGKMWGTLGMAALDPAIFRKAMDTYKYDCSLVRLSDGSFAANPAVHPQNAGGTVDFEYGRKWTTAFNALIFTLGKGQLRIAGRDRLLPVGLNTSATSSAVLQICDSIRSGKSKTTAILQSITRVKKTAKEKDLADLELLETHVMKPLYVTLNKLESLEKSGDIFQLDIELRMLKTSFGTLDIFNENTAHFEQELRKEPWLTEIKLGKNYQQLLGALRQGKKTAADDLEKFSAQHSESLYGKWAHDVVSEYLASGTIKEPTAK